MHSFTATAAIMGLLYFLCTAPAYALRRLALIAAIAAGALAAFLYDPYYGGFH